VFESRKRHHLLSSNDKQLLPMLFDVHDKCHRMGVKCLAIGAKLKTWWFAIASVMPHIRLHLATKAERLETL
jgi:hypothetical protein